MNIYNELILTTNKIDKDVLIDELYNYGIDGIEIIESLTSDEINLIDGDYIDYQRLTQTTSNNVTLKAYIKKDKYLENEKILNKLFPIDSVKTIKDYSFLTAYKEYFHTSKVGNRFVVVPSWEVYSPIDDELVIEIDPGIAFGTGTHATTKNILKLMEKYDFKNKKVADIGCGSGILSIGALKLGAGYLLVLDNDRQAIKTAEENLFYNFIGEEQKVEFKVNSLLDNIDEKFDILLANIVASIIMDLSSEGYQKLAENGLLFASGIILDKWEETNNKLQADGFLLLEKIEEDGWVAAVYRKG
ncbi:hypothetical protein AZF37_05135 [endosymbiont 'TC1' of Trimyema compressum]|uniref:50S ribosomal protein L11 methyltransferase n=1 Tax=endosymbiont 'TC1' of Trimyema compressum TaxID=243899 RepID=UPI0007F0B49F|nr:50S ribosomal protein L11 methyltransferase [endosymbiont 'TC1' of Trimyema compressum]AMP20642.1 hypothetical protein AZF37_05135 [endosymbiont 'TC1' of Trimyema compressum]